MTPLYKKTWFKVVTGLFVLCLLFISFLPFAIRYGIEQWYLKQGADTVTLEDVDLNLFTGELHLKNLVAIKDASPVFELTDAVAEFDWLPLFKKQSFFPRLHINGLKTGLRQLKDGALAVGGVDIPRSSDTSKNETSPWGFGLHSISINNTSLLVNTPIQQVILDFDEITIDHIESWSKEYSQLYYSGKINNSAIIIKGHFSAFSDQPVFEGTISLAALDLSPAAVHLKKQLQSLKGVLDIQSEFKITHDPGKSTRVQTKTDMRLSNLLIKIDESDISLDKFNWKGESQTQLAGDLSLTNFLVLGNIDTENVDFINQRKHHYHHNQLNWNGSIKPSDIKTSEVLVEGGIIASGITFEDLESQLELFHTDKLNIKQLSLSGTSAISTTQITMQNLRTLFKPDTNKDKQEPALLQATSLSIDTASFNPEMKLGLGNILFKDVLIGINRQKDGRLQQLALLQSADDIKTKPKADVDVKAKEQTFAFNIKQIDIGGNSKIRILDQSVSPAFNTEWTIKQANIRNIDSEKSAAPSPYVVDASLDKYSSLKLEGDVYPFSKPISVKLKGKLSNINLPPVSSYTAGLIGYDLRSGQLNADLDLNIVKGKIESTNNLIFSHLEVKPSDPEKAQQLTSQLSMPLDSALSLLRDKNNNIKLNLPVSGDINKPDFDISGIINTAIGTAMKQASMTYLSQALQPYGALITLAKLAKAASDHVSLNPMLFAPASSQADSTSLQYAAKIASLMNERPQLRIKICGKATTKDSQQLIQQKQQEWKSKRASKSTESDTDSSKPPVFTVSDKELLELALQRSEAVKNILVDEHKIDASRLFICQPAIDKDIEAQPRLDLNI